MLNNLVRFNRWVPYNLAILSPRDFLIRYTHNHRFDELSSRSIDKQHSPADMTNTVISWLIMEHQPYVTAIEFLLYGLTHRHTWHPLSTAFKVMHNSNWTYLFLATHDQDRVISILSLTWWQPSDHVNRMHHAILMHDWHLILTFKLIYLSIPDAPCILTFNLMHHWHLKYHLTLCPLAYLMRHWHLNPTFNRIHHGVPAPWYHNLPLKTLSSIGILDAKLHFFFFFFLIYIHLNESIIYLKCTCKL
jgi:hypothetical protein